MLFRNNGLFYERIMFRELDPSSQNFLSEVCTTLRRHLNQHLEASRRSQIFLSEFGGAGKQ